MANSRGLLKESLVDGLDLDRETLATFEQNITASRASYDQVAGQLVAATQLLPVVSQLLQQLSAAEGLVRETSDVKASWLHRRHAELESRIDAIGNIIPL